MTIPVITYLLALWLLRDVASQQRVVDGSLVVGVAIVVLATAFTDHAVLLTGVILAALVAFKVVRRERRTRPNPIS